MTGSLAALAAAMALFVGSHIALAWPRLRAAIVAGLGEAGFLALYSAVALALLVWAVLAYQEAPPLQLWTPPIGLQHLALPLMLPAAVLVVCGYTTPGPSMVVVGRPGLLARGPRGILKVTRHPVMWGTALWGIAHLLADGAAAGTILFGGLTLLALLGAAAQDVKKRTLLGPAWDDYAARTSFVPFAAIVSGRTRVTAAEIGWWRLAAGVALYALLIWAHPWLFGVSPLPL